MKKYRLKQWYPSLHEDIEEGIEVEYKDGWIYYVNTRGNKTCVEFDLNEFIFTDFWELIEEEKPKLLFVTDDGVELFDEADKLFIVNKKCNKQESKISNIFDKTNRKDFKYFFHESSADEYIWKNKRVFSYEDFIRWGNVPYQRVIEKLAKERVCNG